MEGGILIPPSPNWFINKATDSRTEDGLYVSACFKSIAVYEVSQEVDLPKVLKVIPHTSEKILMLRIHPQANDPDYGRTVICCGESSVRLIDIDSGAVISSHKEHQNKAINGLSWCVYNDEAAAVSVGGNHMIVWQPKQGLTRTHTIAHVPELTSVEVNPDKCTQAVVAAGKTIFLIEIKNGTILTQLQGHNFDIYSMKWFTGSGCPFSSDELEQTTNNGSEDKENQTTGSESDNWRAKKSQPSFSGPFVVSSDYGRQIYLWDVTAKRYIANVTVPITASGYSKKFQGKEKVQGKNHVSLAWVNNQLISSTPKGELLTWELWPGGGKFKTLHNFHSRTVYGIEVIGDAVISVSQDRMIHGYHMGTSRHIFQYPTLGSAAVSLAFCPHDFNRLAIGTQDSNIRLLNFESEIPLHSHVVWQNIKGKVLAIAWHPEQEGKLLFGTASGQVGFADMASGRVTIFAYYHQKSVYKVEWAPSVCPEKSGLGDPWCAYSFGDREIAIRSSGDPMADPVILEKLFPEVEKHIKEITEFSFSPDYKFLAIGGNDGQVYIYRSLDLQLLVSISALRKAIQHLLWKPPTDTILSYILVVGSNETKICLFNLTSQLQGETGVQVLTQATQELCGHDSRVVWLTWSPHKPEVLASASYDHTVQLWDTNTGSPLVNYGGHNYRVFRVEFSPSDPDLMYSFAEESTIHAWKPSQITSKTTNESLAALKGHSKKVKEQAKEETSKKDGSSVSSAEKKLATPSTTGEKPSSGVSTSLSNKKNTYKSFFPKLHSVCARKKSFFHMLILNLLESEKKENKSQGETEELEDELTDELEESIGKMASKEPRTLSSIAETCNKFSFLLEKDTEMPDPEDTAYALQIYGTPLEMDALLTSEISEHKKKENTIQADLMHSWQGSLDDHIRNAARLKKLNPFLVSSAPQVSMKLWEFASEAYAEQLINEGDIITAATYMVNINKIEEAVGLLLKHRLFREALAIAKCRLGYSEELSKKVIKTWASYSIYEGVFDVAAALHVSIGDIEDAARCISRRNQPGALFMASQLYRHAGKEDLLESIGLLALREVCIRHEHEVITEYLSYLPELQWFNVISTCHITFLKLLQQVSAKEQKCANYCLLRDVKLSLKDSENVAASQEKTEEVLSDKNGTANSVLPILEYILEEWNRQGITKDQYSHLYDTISSNMATQRTPTSVKQLWFLVAVAISEYLMTPNEELRELHLATALNHSLSWGKADQIYHLSHALLPKGTSDLSTLLPLNSEAKPEISKGVSMLLLLYHTSDTCVLHSLLQREGSLSDVSHNSYDSDGAKRCDTDSVSVCNTGSLSESENPSVPKDSKMQTQNVERDEDKQSVQTEDMSVGDQYMCSLPRTKAELLIALHFNIDFFCDYKDTHNIEAQIYQCLSDPKKLLLETSRKLKEREYCSDEDLKSLLSKLGSFENLI